MAPAVLSDGITWELCPSPGKQGRAEEATFLFVSGVLSSLRAKPLIFVVTCSLAREERIYREKLMNCDVSFAIL